VSTIFLAAKKEGEAISFFLFCFGKKKERFLSWDETSVWLFWRLEKCPKEQSSKLIKQLMAGDDGYWDLISLIIWLR